MMSENKVHDQQTLSDNLDQELFAKRNIFIIGDIDEDTAGIVIKQLISLSKSNEPIKMFIYSEGGDTEAASAIIDTIQMVQVTNEIKIIAYKALSCAAYIVSVGTKGSRYAFANSIFMLHRVTFEFPMDSEDNQKACIEFTKKQNDSLYKLIAKCCGKTKDNFCKDMTHDLYMNATEAKKYKLVDEIIEEVSEIC
jgi:ATP-dependent Clp protease protease subunit